MRPQQSPPYHAAHITWRIRLWYGCLVLLAALFIIRVFYLQILRHDYYRKVALSAQLKETLIPAERGIIEAKNGDQTIPIVLNETLYTVFADPLYIKDLAAAAGSVQSILGGDAKRYEESMKIASEKGSRYVVLAKKIDKGKKEQLDALQLKGVGTRPVPYRTYPQGTLAAQLLGFVDDEGVGKYGLEQALNDTLKGTPGELKAITDAQGVPLATNKDNVLSEPLSGDRVTLTVDLGMQQQVEELLKTGLDAAKSKSGSAVILEANTGAIKAMANYPTYNPAEFYKVEDASVFNNAVVSAPLEPGSIMKPLVVAAAIDRGVVNENTSYYDPSFFQVDDATVKNVEEDGGAGTRNMGDILQLSLNTGATWLLMQMGGGSINSQARTVWNDYMTNHFGFGKLTGVEQGYESQGVVPPPNDGYGLNITYANTAFGQGVTVTPLQMAAALASVVNGGTYYQPHLVERVSNEAGKREVSAPKALKSDVVSGSTSKQVRNLMEYVMEKNHVLYGMPNLRSQFAIGGKTGTAEIANPAGGYYDDRFNGTFMGYVGGDSPQYVIVIRVNEPTVAGYAGAKAAAPIFSSIANVLIDNFSVTPKN